MIRRLSPFSYLSGAAVALVLSLSAPLAFAQDNDDDDGQAAKLASALEKQGKKLEAEEKALKAEERKLAAEEAEFDSLKAKIEKVTGKKIAGRTQSESVAGGIAGTQAHTNLASNDVPEEVGTDRKPVAPDKPPEVAKYIEEGGVLLPKGTLMITPGFEYDRSNATNVAIQGFSIIPALNIGDFNVSKVDQDTLIETVDARLGVTNRFEIEAKVPYVFSQQQTVGEPVGVPSASATTSNLSGSDLGDIEFAAHYQINKGENNWPYFIGNLRYKTDTGTGPFQISVDKFGQETSLPTGSGFNAIQPSFTAIYPLDPVVFYGNLGYTHNFERSFLNYGTIDPGDSINGSFGMSVSLNDSTSFSLGYSHNYVFATSQNGNIVPGSENLEVGSVDLGWSYIINDKVSLDVNASIGVTDDAPSDRVIVRVPIAFDVF